MRETDEELVPITRAAGECGLGYQAARNKALKGELELRWVGTRMHVTRGSLERFKASRIRKRTGARELTNSPAR